MPPASALRAHIEAFLAERVPHALDFRPALAPEMVPTGIAEVDQFTGGGVPIDVEARGIAGGSAGADEAADCVAGALEILREGGADEACGAGDEDFHGVLFGGMIIAQVEMLWSVYGEEGSIAS